MPGEQEIARLTVALDARIDQFERKVASAEKRFARAADGMKARGQEVDRVVSNVGGRKFAFGNVAQQFQDIAVQAQSGTAALTIFAQQGPQIASAFGPVGAIIGAVIGVAALAGSAFLGMGSDAEDAKAKMDRLALSTGELDSGVAGLEETARRYAEAISATATAQSAASGSIIADTAAEFEAKKALLELEVKRQQALQAERQVELSRLRGEIDARPAGSVADAELGAIVGGGLSPDLDARVAAYESRLPGLQDEFKRLNAEATLAELAIQKALDATSADFGTLAARGSGGSTGRSGGGGGRRRRAAEDPLASARAQIAALEEQAAAVGLYGAELDGLQARLAANRLESELLAKVVEDGVAPTDAQKLAIRELRNEYFLAAERLATLRSAEEARIETLRETARATEAAARQFDQFSSGLISAAANARTFEDALEAVISQIVTAGVQGLFGTGPFAGSLGSVIGSAFGPPADFGIRGPVAAASAPVAPMFDMIPRFGATPKAAASAPMVNVTVNSDRSFEVSTRTGADGRSIEVGIDQTVARAIGDPGSATSRALALRGKVRRA